jgi:hypothetical protein
VCWVAERGLSRPSEAAEELLARSAERRENLARLREATNLLLGEDEPVVGDDVVLALGACDRFRVESLAGQLGRETRGPFVITVSDGAEEDFDAHRHDGTGRSGLHLKWRA